MPEIFGENTCRILPVLYFLLVFPGETYPIPCGHLSVEAYLTPQLPIATDSKNIAVNVEAINEQVSGLS